MQFGETMTKINIIGQFLGTSGYASHTRQLANALSKVCDVRIITQMYPGFEKELTDDELVNIKKQDDKERINIIIALPHSWKMLCDRDNNVGFLVWEGDKIPISWLDDCKNKSIKQIWVPSKHTKDAVLKTISESKKPSIWNDVIKKLRIVPHGVDFSLFFAKEKPTAFTFLCNKGYRNIYDRGGIQYVVQAFAEEFEKDECRLLLKINPAYNSSPLPLHELHMKFCSGRTDILVAPDNIPFSDMINVYNGCHVFVSATRAEAFNIPCVEAMACGLPVVTTNFGGQTDFVDSSFGYLVDYNLTEIKHELMYEGIKWATPDIKDLRKGMRQMFELWKNNKYDFDKLSLLAIEKSKLYTWESSARIANANLCKII